MAAERSEYKGRPVLILKESDDDKYPFSFGLKKARLILDHLEEIQNFVAEQEQ